MPELLEAEIYAATAELVIGRVVAAVQAVPAYERIGEAPIDVLVGSTVSAVCRVGKVVLVEFDRPSRIDTEIADEGDSLLLALRFGMTGRLLVDGAASIDSLVYGPSTFRPEWVRFSMRFVPPPGGSLQLVDPRRLGSVGIIGDESSLGLGPDAASLAALVDGAGSDGVLTAVSRLHRLVGSDGAIKSKLLDQTAIAGIGNLLADDILWRSGISPQRAASSLSAEELEDLVRGVRASLDELRAQGGSHTGALQPFRRSGGGCPRCDGVLRIDRIGGRTTVWCPTHQR